MQSHQKYERPIYTGVEESLSKIAAKISNNSLVLDIGCGAGMLGHYLTQEKNCVVDGVDSNAAAIEISRSKYRLVAVKNLEVESLSDIFQTATYDYIVVADVLEHLVSSDRLLFELKKLIKPQGTIIFSVPNITHISVGLDLLFGHFEYRENGLLDDTHLRFFTRQSLLRKLNACGLHAWEIDTVQKAIPETEFSRHASDLFPRQWIDALTLHRDDALTYQWLISTKTFPQDTQSQTGTESSIISKKPSLLFTSGLYWADEENPDFSEDKKLIGHISQDDSLATIEFLFSEASNINGLSKIRIDPVSDQKPFLIANAEILTPTRDVVWKWQPSSVDSELYGANLVGNFASVGCLFQSTNRVPQWHPSIDKRVLCQITTGWTFKLSLKIDDSLLNFFNGELIKESLFTVADRMEREGEINNLQQSIAQLEHQINNLQDKEGELQALSNDLRNQIEAFRSTKSWRITKPLREVSQLRVRFIRLAQAYKKYKKIYPGLNGSMRLLRRTIRALSEGGIKGLKDAIYLHEHQRGNTTSLTKDYRSTHQVLMLKDETEARIVMPLDVAVHVHVYYLDIAREIRLYLQNIPVKFHLYVTTDSAEKLEAINQIFSGLENAKALETHVSENRGRDIFPMLVTLGNKLVKHELVLHIHTKRSPHNTWELSGWRRYLLESLLGNSRRVASILQKFIQDDNLGILFPEYHHSIRQFVYMPGSVNEKNMKKLLLCAEKKKNTIDDIDRTFYPAGDMFWFRGKAIQSLVDMNLNAEDFETESGQLNNTLAHAIERMFPYFANEAGLTSKAFLADSFLSQDCSAHKFALLKTYIKDGVIKNPTVFFDHNGGGGTTTFTRDFVENVNSTGESVLRIYCFEAIWFVHWIGDGDGMLFYTLSLDELFETLSLSHATNVVLNSIYGYPDIKKSIDNIISLVLSLKIPLDVKMHDFYAICPSPHLLDFEGKYCGVPQDLNKCTQCLKKNLGWYHSWYPVENRVTDISDWRKSFADLFRAATTLTFFDKSSVEILDKAFSIDYSKVRVLPHTSHYFQCDKPIDIKGPLHIATLGTLSIPKGGNIVNELYKYILAEKLQIPVTVLGASFVDLIDGIRIYGSYENGDLPNIIQQQKINVIFIASIIPETFSYTVSEAIKMKLPIVAFDIGAQGNRVKQYALGEAVPPGSSPEVILEAMRSVLKIAKENN